MTLISRILLMTTLGLSTVAMAQQHEIGLTLGRLVSQDRGASPTKLNLGSGVALQANYGYKLFGTPMVSLYAEAHLLASPLRDVSSLNLSLTRDVASLYITPGLRLKLLPKAKLSPYVAAGAGYALYEQSTNVLGTGLNPAARFIHRGAVVFGGGVDYPMWHFIALRAEVRDFYTGSPAFNTRTITGGQHNVVAGGGFVIRLP